MRTPEAAGADSTHSDKHWGLSSGTKLGELDAGSRSLLEDRLSAPAVLAPLQSGRIKGTAQRGSCTGY